MPGEPATGWVRFHPDHRRRLEALGLRDAPAFLGMPGPVVSGHPDRHVRRVELGGRTTYLKVEHRVPWRDRLRHFLLGGGFVSKSVREADLLSELESLGLPAPGWLACGEDGRGRAFLLVAAVPGAVELRRCRMTPRRRLALAKRIGIELARMHSAGIDHPDLHAKHVLIAPGPSVVWLDWQNARRLPVVDWPRRVRALAWLDATLADELVSERERGACLAAYLRHSRHRAGLRKIAAAVRHRSTNLLRRRAVQEARRPLLATEEQQLVWLDGEAICAVPSVAEELARPHWRSLLYGGVAAQTVTLADGRSAWLVRRQGWAPGRIISWLKRKAWRSPELRAARILFYLPRQRVPCVRLLAFGQRLRPFAPAQSFLLTERVPDARPLGDWLVQHPDEADTLRAAAATLLEQLHTARCHFRSPTELAESLLVRSGPTLMIGRGDLLRLARRPLTRRLIQRDRHSLARLFGEAGR